MVDFSRRRDDDRGRGRDDDRGRGRDDDRGRRDDRGRDDRSSSRGRDDDRGRGRDDRDSRGRDDRGSRGRDDDRGGSRGRSSGSGRSYQYQARSAADVNERATKGAKDFDKFLKPNIKMYKVKDGLNRVRFLPPTWPEAKHFGLDIYMHYGVGPDRQSFLDLKRMLGKDDPISEEYELARNEDRPDEAYVKQLDSKRRVLSYLIDRDNPREGIQAWAAPWTFDRDLVKISVDRSTGEVLPIDDPHDGYDIEFEKQGKGDRTEYLGISVARRSTPLGDEEAMDFAVDNPLPDQLVYFDYDHIAKAFGAKGQQRDSGRGRDDDRDRDRGRDDRGRDDPPPRSSGRDSRGRDDDRRGGRDDGKLTWARVHDMTPTELEDLIDQERLDIDPRDAKDETDLADWICDELKLEEDKQPERGRDDRGRADRGRDDPPPSRTRDDPPARRRDPDDEPPARGERRRDPDDAPNDKLAEMRRRRAD